MFFYFILSLSSTRKRLKWSFVNTKLCQFDGTNKTNALYLNRKKPGNQRNYCFIHVLFYVTANELCRKTPLAKLSIFKLFSCLVDIFWALSRLKKKIVRKNAKHFLCYPLSIMGAFCLPFLKQEKNGPPRMPFVVINQLISVTEMFNSTCYSISFECLHPRRSRGSKSGRRDIFGRKFT